MWKLAFTKSETTKSCDDFKTSATTRSSPIFVYHIGRHGYRTSDTTFKGIIRDESQNFPYFDEIEGDFDESNYINI